MSGNLTIGVTGGIGSGKSMVCRILKILGVPVYDADSRARYILNNDTHLRKGIIELFGNDAYTAEGLNNQWIGNNVFGDIQKLDQLNKLVHPRVGKDFEVWKSEKINAQYVIKEAALLFESGSYKILDKIVVVTAPEDLRIQRIIKRDPHRTLEQIQDILKSQWPEEEKIEKADFLINNDGTQLLVPQILALHDKITNEG